MMTTAVNNQLKTFLASSNRLITLYSISAVDELNLSSVSFVTCLESHQNSESAKSVMSTIVEDEVIDVDESDNESVCNDKVINYEMSETSEHDSNQHETVDETLKGDDDLNVIANCDLMTSDSDIGIISEDEGDKPNRDSKDLTPKFPSSFYPSSSSSCSSSGISDSDQELVDKKRRFSPPLVSAVDFLFAATNRNSCRPRKGALFRLTERDLSSHPPFKMSLLRKEFYIREMIRNQRKRLRGDV